MEPTTTTTSPRHVATRVDETAVTALCRARDTAKSGLPVTKLRSLLAEAMNCGRRGSTLAKPTIPHCCTSLACVRFQYSKNSVDLRDSKGA